jgi:arylsulfatase
VGHIIDVMATCVDVGGATYPQESQGKKIVPAQGKSLLPIFRGEHRAGHDALFWTHEGNKAVRQGKWKLVSRHPEGWELYDIEADRTELHDLAGQQPEKVRDLTKLWDRWAAEVGVVAWDVFQGRNNARKAAKEPPAGK